ncbi:hypothetical protein BH24ACT1_BH24ACT1_12870 [soil metagenome]
MTGSGVASRRGKSSRRPLITYVAFVVLGVAALVLVLPAGSRLAEPPLLPASSQVTDAGRPCLGERLRTVQSGVLVDLHVPSPAAGGQAGDELGPRVARGRVDLASATATLRGSCAPGTELAGQRHRLELQVGPDAEATGEPDDRVDGTLVVAGTAPVGLSLRPAEAGNPAGDPEPLAGSELTGRILLAVAVVILASRAVGFLFSRVRQPRVVGEIVAGILLGPSLMGLILPGVTGYLFPPEVVDILTVVAQFGLIFFMFLIGLELDLTLVARSGRVAVLVSHVSIVFPFVLGLVASLVVYPLLGTGDFVGFALFLGAALAITAFPVLARILTDTGLHRTRLGALAITCAAIDDVTAWCLLAVVVAVVKSSGALDVVATIGLSLVFVAAMILVVRPLLARLARSPGTWSRLHPPVMAALFAGLFLAAWATEEIGIHAIFGAFLLGAVMPRSEGLVAKVAERIEDVTVLFLLPVFFVVVGLSTRIGLLDQAVLWWILLLILGVAVVGKWAGSMLAARAYGQGWRDATALGALMNTRGLTEIVILTIGASLGVVSPALFTIMVVMALVTTLMATPLLGIIYPRRLIDREPATSPEHRQTGDRFDHRVLVGVGSPERSGALLDLARDLCRAPGQRSEAILAHVAPPSGREEVRANLAALDAAATAARAEMGPLGAELMQAGVDTRLRASVGTEVARELRRLAGEEGADLVVLGWHGVYAKRHELTGVVADFLAEASCPVAVLLDHHIGPADDPAPVAVWWSRRAADLAALDVALRIAGGRGGGIRVVRHASSQPPDRITGLACEDVVVASHEDDVLQQAFAGASLIVIGRDQAESRRDLVLGAAGVPALIVQAAGAAERGGKTATPRPLARMRRSPSKRPTSPAGSVLPMNLRRHQGGDVRVQ